MASNNQKKLTEKQELNVFHAFTVCGDSKAHIAKRYGISSRTVGRIIERIAAKKIDQAEVPDSVEVLEPAEVLDIEIEFASEEDTSIEPDVEDEEDVRYEVVANDRSVTIIKGDESITLTKGDDKFDEVSEIVWSERGSQESLKRAFLVGSVKEQIRVFSEGKVSVDAKRGTVSIDIGYPVTVPAKLVGRLLSMLREANISGLKAYCKFTEKLFQNPSAKTVEELYDFLEAGDIEIDDEGRVICYKKVRGDFLDVYSRSIDNSVGARPKMPRNLVDDRSKNTCSRGLHVCSKAYLSHYPGDRVVQVAVEPFDFVSIPEDYYRKESDGTVKAKARVCEYEVLAEVTGKI